MRMSKEDEKWLSSHTKFNLGLTVKEIQALQVDAADLSEQLKEARAQLADMILASDMEAELYNGQYYAVAWKYNRLSRAREAAAAWLAGQEEVGAS